MFRQRKKAKKDGWFQRKGHPTSNPTSIPRTMSIESMDSAMSDASTIYSFQKDADSRDFKLANIFWRAKLSCHPYHVGDPLVTFGDLWPRDDLLKGLIACFKGAELQDSVVPCCKLVLRCGPTRVLSELLDQRVIGIEQRLEFGMGLLHYAVLACNGEAVSFLCARGAPVKQQDKSGRTADQLCYCPRTRRCLPARYQAGSAFRKKQPSSFHDKKVIFELVQQPDRFNDLQILIQTMDFDINHDRDQKGNLLLHAAVKGGLAQLGLILNLVQVHGANVEAANRKGMTSLCLAAQLGLDTIVEVLICIIGADPNTQNPLNGWTALHYAAQRNHISVIDCLVKRGADLNLEDGFNMRADDIAMRCENTECRELICSLRHQRCIALSQLVRSGNLGPNDGRVRLSDHFNVDNDGLTLIMAAAKANRCDNLSILLKELKCPINAQHHNTGRTALTLAAIDGNANVIQTLLSHNALPNISDIQGKIALHYACSHGHVDCVEVIVGSRQGLHGLYDAYHYAKDPHIRDRIRAATERRQRDVVSPTLFECAMNGDASKIYGMLEEGDDVNPLTGTSDWPMYMAVGNGHFEVIKLLEQYGGDVCCLHSTTLSTVLHVACSRGLQEIVRYLLEFCRPNEQRRTIDINAVNKAGVTALQLAAAKGYSSIVKMLLENGASAAIVDEGGKLYQCSEYEGVQALIEKHRRNRTDRIMLSIKDKKRFKHLKKMWQPKFDHNLRNKAGDTPLMTACLNGRLDVVKFLLETAIQNTEEVVADFERSMRWQRRDSDSDSGTFLESHSPGTSRKLNASADFMDLSTDYSDLEGGDLSAFHPAMHGLYPIGGSTPRQPQSQHFQDYSSDSDSNMTYESLKRTASIYSGSQGNRRKFRAPMRGLRQYNSDTEALDSVFELPGNRGLAERGLAPFDVNRLDSIKEEKGVGYAPSLASIRSTSMMSLTDTECTSLSRLPDSTSLRSFRPPGSTYGGASERQHSRAPSMSEIYLSLGQPTRPSIYQGSTINHLAACNPLDGCTAFHRAIQCSDQKTGATILTLLLTGGGSSGHSEAAMTVVNIQNAGGLTALHLACHLDRRQAVKELLSVDCIDLDLRTLEGNLPEQMARSDRSRCARMIRNARTQVDKDKSFLQGNDPFPTPPSSTVGGSSVDFDKLDERFEQMKRMTFKS